MRRLWICCVGASCSRRGLHGCRWRSWRPGADRPGDPPVRGERSRVAGAGPDRGYTWTVSDTEGEPDHLPRRHRRQRHHRLTLPELRGHDEPQPRLRDRRCPPRDAWRSTTGPRPSAPTAPFTITPGCRSRSTSRSSRSVRSPVRSRRRSTRRPATGSRPSSGASPTWRSTSRPAPASPAVPPSTRPSTTWSSRPKIGFIDGPGGVLGEAGPCGVSTSDHLTRVGTMQFDRRT